MTHYQRQQLDILEKENILNEKIRTTILASDDVKIESYVSSLLYKKKIILEVFSHSHIKRLEYLNRIEKIKVKELLGMKKKKDNNEKSIENWKRMKAASSKGKGQIGTKVSIRTIFTNMKNQ